MLRLLPALAALAALGCADNKAPLAWSTATPSTSKPATQAANPRAALLAQARQIADATLAGDAQKSADMAMPAVISMIGGRDKYVQATENAMGSMRRQGFNIAAIEIGEATDPVAAPSGLYAVVRYTLRMSTPGGGSSPTPAFFLAASQDGGVTWKFADGAGFKQNPALVKRLVPDLPAGLTLPTQ